MFKIDTEIVKIMELVEGAGHQIYLVGGYVRDRILNRHSLDVDLATSIPIKHLEKLLKRYEIFEVNHRFGSLKLELKAYDIEITRFRVESQYEDKRHPSKVLFTDDIHEDYLRRDFTMNSLYMDLNGQTLDPSHGYEDIENKIIRTVRNPEDVLSEDALRIVRLFRFQNELNFDIEPKTIQAAKENLSTIGSLSLFQLKDEMIKILSLDNLSDLYIEHKDFMEVLFSKAKMNKKILDFSSSWEYKLLFMYDIESLEEILNKWQIKKRKRNYLLELKRMIENYKVMTLEELFLEHGAFMWFEMMTLFLNFDRSFVYKQKFLRILNDINVRDIDDLLIDGNDLIDLNIPNKLRKTFLRQVLYDVLWHGVKNEKNELLQQIKRYKNDIH